MSNKEMEPCIQSPIHWSDDDDVSMALANYLVRSGNIRLLAELVASNPILSQAVLKIREAAQDLVIIPDETETSSQIKAQQYWLNSLRTPWRGGNRGTLISRATWHLIARGECYLSGKQGTVQHTFEILDRNEWTIDLEKGTKRPYQMRNMTTGKVLPFIQWPETEPEFAIRISMADFEDDLPHSPLRGALEARDVFSLIYQQARAILENKPALSGIVSAENGVWSKEGMQKIESRLARFRVTGSKAGGFLVLNSKASIAQFNTNIDKVLTPEARRDTANDISIAIGVPLEVMGLGQTTYANMTTARSIFAENVITSYGNPICAAISSAVLPPFAPLIIDRDKVEALRLNRITSMVALEPLTFIDENEKRELSGFGPRKGKQKNDKPNPDGKDGKPPANR